MKKTLKIFPIILVTLFSYSFVFTTEGTGCRIEDFSANKGEINKGETVTLEWKTKGCSGVEIEANKAGESNKETLGSLSLSGKTSFSPQKSTVYTLNAKQGDHIATSFVVLVQVAEELNPTCNIIMFSAEENTITKGGSTTLKWETENCDWVRIIGIEDALGFSGEKTVSPEEDSNYTLIVGQRNYDFDIERSVRIRVNQEQGENQGDQRAYNVNPRTGSTTISDDSSYQLLAPLGDYTHASIDPKDPNFVGGYLNQMFLFAIGIISALAVIMLIVAGIQYMGQESIFTKTKAKEQITNALLGLLIALGSFVILETISPSLTGEEGLFIKQTTLIFPDSGDGTTDNECKNQSATYKTEAPVNSKITDAVKKLRDDGWVIDKFEVNSNSNTFTVLIKKSNTSERYETRMMPGVNGYAEEGKGKVQDKKTPKGGWKIVSIHQMGGENRAYCSSGNSNMGAAFWVLDPVGEDGNSRGIGIHGNKDGTLSRTNGCIRLTNSDILALQPYVSRGISVIIK